MIWYFICLFWGSICYFCRAPVVYSITVRCHLIESSLYIKPSPYLHQRLRRWLRRWFGWKWWLRWLRWWKARRKIRSSIVILFDIYFLLFGEFLKLTYAVDFAKSIDELDALCGFKCLATNFSTVNWQCGSGTNDPCLCFTSTSPQTRCTDPKICQDNKWTGIDTGPDGIKLLGLVSTTTTNRVDRIEVYLQCHCKKCKKCIINI